MNAVQTMIDQNGNVCPAATGQTQTDDNEAIGETLTKKKNTIINPLAQHSPPSLPVIAGNIPEALKEFPQWVCWRYTLKGGKWTKPPYQPNGRAASKTNSDHFSDFSDVIAAYAEGGFSGIGFVLTAHDPFVAIDIDHCLSDGILTEEAQGIIALMNSYTEVSPSGTGIRIFAKGTIPRNFRKGIEVYAYDSYLTVTGQRWGL